MNAPVAATAVGAEAAGQPLVCPQAVIFDWDNTLVDSWGCIHAAMNRTLTRMGHAPWDMDEIKRRVALSLRDSFPGLFGDRWEEARDVFYASFAEIHLDTLKPLPGVEVMLERLGGLDIRMGVVSNKNGRFLREEAAHLGWQRHFHRLVGATDAVKDKPSAEPVRLVLDSMGLAAGPAVWFVGDAAVDMQCGLAAGCVPILLREDAWREGEFDGCPPSRHLRHCGAVLDLVHELLVPISPV